MDGGQHGIERFKNPTYQAQLYQHEGVIPMNIFSKQFSTNIFTAAYFLCLLSTISFHNSAHADLIAIDFNGTLVEIDKTTGVGVPIGGSGVVNGLNAVASDSTGTFYSAGGTGLNVDNDLYTFDLLTGVASSIATLNLGPVVSVRGMAFSPGDTLYALNNGGGLTSTIVDDELYTINPLTGMGTLVGSTGLTAIQAISFSSAGALFGWDIGLGLLGIDPLTGIATDINVAIGATANIQTIAFDTDGTLYGAGDALYTIDTITGMVTLIGSGGYTDVRGMDFMAVRVVVPEPTTLALLGVGLLAGAGYQRGKRRIRAA